MGCAVDPASGAGALFLDAFEVPSRISVASAAWDGWALKPVRVRVVRYWGASMAGSRAKPWVEDDQPWALIEPLLPVPLRRFRYPGRRRLDDRLVLQGILFVLHTGIGWEHLSPELGYGSG